MARPSSGIADATPRCVVMVTTAGLTAAAALVMSDCSMITVCWTGVVLDGRDAGAGGARSPRGRGSRPWRADPYVPPDASPAETNASASGAGDHGAAARARTAAARRPGGCGRRAVAAAGPAAGRVEPVLRPDVESGQHGRGAPARAGAWCSVPTAPPLVHPARPVRPGRRVGGRRVVRVELRSILHAVRALRSWRGSPRRGGLGLATVGRGPDVEDARSRFTPGLRRVKKRQWSAAGRTVTRVPVSGADRMLMRPLVHVHDGLDDRQAQPGAAGPQLRRPRAAPEALEHVGHLVGRDAHAGVGHR